MTELHFIYPNRANPLLAELRMLSEVASDPAKTDIENAKALIGYAHGLFPHNGDNVPSANDPLTILKEAKQGHAFRCVEYSILAAGLLWANNIPARTIGLKTRDVETRNYGAGHVAIEFWSKERNKWVMSDVQAGVIPESEGLPLSAYELKIRLSENVPVAYSPVHNSRFSDAAAYGDKPSYTEWIKEYLFFIDTPIALTLGNEDRSKQQIAMLVPAGTKHPVMFQGMFKMDAIYTTDVASFYAQPESALPTNA